MSDFQPNSQGEAQPDLLPTLEPTEPAAPEFAPSPKRKSNRTGNVLLGVAGLVAIGGIAFAAGRMTAPAAAATGGFQNGPVFPNGSFNPGAFPNGGPQGGPGGFGARLGGAGLQGEVTSISDTSISIKLDNGSTIDVPVDNTTEYQTATQGTHSDVVVGSSVLVQSSDVQFNPGQPGASPNPAASAPPITFGSAEKVIVLDD